LDFQNIFSLLQEYGLTKNQSKIFFALTQNQKKLTVKQISQSANIARESIYRTLGNLVERGIVEKTIKNPIQYNAIPLKRALKILYEQKKAQMNKIAKLTSEVLIEYNQNTKINSIKEKDQFILVPRKKQLLHKISEAMSNSKKTIKVITSWKRHLQAQRIYKKALNKALLNNVKIQVLVTEKPKHTPLPNYVKSFHDHPNTEVVVFTSPSKVIEIIIDDKEIFLITDPSADLAEAPALWSNNPSLIEALKTCFDVIF
jgi:sugar-specific transcriptional regulator TrmB